MSLKSSQAYMNLLHYDYESAAAVASASSKSSSDSETEIVEMHRSVSITSVHSDFVYPDEANSKTNLLVGPSVSASSIIESSDQLKIVELQTDGLLADKLAKNSQIQFDDELDFTREQLQNRLKHLIATSLKKFNGDPEVTNHPLFSSLIVMKHFH